MKHKRFIVLAIALVVALGMCPMAFAVDRDLAPAKAPAQGELEAAQSGAKQLFLKCTVVAKTRIPVGSKNMNPVKSVKSPSGKVLREGKGYWIDYYSADVYGDLTKRMKEPPTEPGRYMALLYPKDTKAYIGSYCVYYQVTPKGFVEHPFTEAQKAEITPSVSGDDGYCNVYDSHTPWNHYAKKGSKKYNAYIAEGMTAYSPSFNDSSIRFFLRDPNDGSYLITSSQSSFNEAYTQIGLTYNVALCVDLAEASYSLNKLADTVSAEAGLDVPAKYTWVSLESYKALENAISKAEKVATTKGASKSKVKSAKKQLDKALKGFNPKPGKKGKKMNLKKAKVGNVESKTFTSAAVRQNPAVTYGKMKLTPGKHYTITYKKGSKTVKPGNVKAVGTYKVIITGKGTCTGKIAKTFKIKKESMRHVIWDYIPTQKLKKAGEAVTPKVEAMLYYSEAGVSARYTLKQGRDYTLSYKNNTKAGWAQAILTGKGNFTGKEIANFVIE